MNTQLSAQETPLHKVFSDDYLFTMPAVQRPYSWTTDEAGELLDDLLDFIDHYGITQNSIKNMNEPYFLGSIVLVKQKDPLSQVLDGQQRLTTITILLAVLRDYLSEDFAEEIDDLIVQKGSRIRNIADTFRLQLRSRDNEFFQKHIQQRKGTQLINGKKDLKTDSQILIRDNAVYFMDKLNGLDESTVHTLSSVIINLCYFVVVSTPNFESAFRIFTVLNDRGLDLMISDIFKAKVIGDIDETEKDVYTNKWEDVEVSLGRERFNKLFDHIRMIIQKRKGSANYKDEYDEIFKQICGKRFIDEILIPYSEIYLKLVEFRSYYIENPKLLKVLSLLNRIDNIDWIPPAMYYMHHFNENLEDFFNRLEKMAGSSMVLRKNFNWRQSRYSQLLKEMDRGIDIYSPTSSLQIKDDDKIEVLERISGDFYIDLKDSARRYVLLRLDSLLTTGQPYYDDSVITVEHVLPQTPPNESHWLEDFHDPKEYVHKLGNLVLLTRSKNSQAKNYDFQKKKTAYFQSSKGVTTFALTTQVIQEEKWTPDVLEVRQTKLIKLLKDAWGLSISKSEKLKLEVDDLEFFINNVRANAKGKLCGEDFLVCKGSQFSEVESEALQTHCKSIRGKLISKNLLIKNNHGLELIEDYIFSSPSTAAAVVLGRSANGLTEWKSKDGKVLKEFLN